jgi:spermidine synthase
MAYFAICIFLSAFLLFQVEPMIAKLILPWFGGSSAVWSTVVLFFQVLLTGGYAYADWLLHKTRRREIIHLVLLGVSLVLMVVLAFIWKSPITPSANWKPLRSDSPIWGIFRLLFISVGLPYFLLSSNSPLIQAWFDRTYPEKGAYRLYALSNLGSLLGLVTYPVLIEPYLTLAWQGRIWSMVYLLYAGLAAYGAVKALQVKPGLDPIKVVSDGTATNLPDGSRPGVNQYILWIALAATASILLLAVTSEITQEVAVIPFLWVLPLTIYLLSFVLAFSGERWYSRQIYLLLFFASTLLAGWALAHADNLSVFEQIGIYGLVLFSACMVCHGELYRMRPHPVHLTSFYFMVSIGGALGGALINFVAPNIFKGFWELPLGLTLCWLVFLLVTLNRKPSRPNRWVFIANEVLLLSALVIAGVRSYQLIRSDLGNDLLIERNFYGVLRVRQKDFYAVIPISLEGRNITAYHRFALIHGVTIHGYQFHDDTLRNLPTSYYGKSSGAGLAIINHPNRGKGMRVGVLGLGVGTLAQYGQPGDVYRFYEINPIVIRLAEGENGYFSFLADSQAKVEVIPGDARLSMEQELAAGEPQNYDVLAVDVFSSDSIPVHLLDEEAFQVYLQQLCPQGILAIHISNRRLDLVPVVWTLANHFNLARVLINDPGNGVITYPSSWILLASDPNLLANPAIAARAESMDNYVSPVRLWTDDYNNLFQILK